MQFGMVGLGKMGANMVRRLRHANIELAGFDKNPSVVESLADEVGMVAASSLEDLVDRLRPPRLVWMMLPAGEPTEQCTGQMKTLLRPGDVLIDGGNSWYKDSVRRGAALQESGILFVDAGVSGGTWGLARGYALMIGGPDDAIKALLPVIRSLAPEPAKGWTHTGPVGTGHFVKMIHNGIEYGMMQAYAEGFALLRGHENWQLDLARIADSWREGSVIQSWLLDLITDVLMQDQSLDGILPVVADSGEGRWTAIEAIEQGIAAPVISGSLNVRLASQDSDKYGERLLAMMRNAFGGHSVQSGGDMPNSPETGDDTSG